MEETTNILRAIVIGSASFALDLPVFELARILASIAHEDDSLAILFALLICALVLEVWVRVSISALSVTQLSHRIDATNIAVLCHHIGQVAYITGARLCSTVLCRVWLRVIVLLDRDLRLMTLHAADTFLNADRLHILHVSIHGGVLQSHLELGVVEKLLVTHLH